jgi:DNA-directed RNA polymerase subunit RPC12/RpoP
MREVTLHDYGVSILDGNGRKALLTIADLRRLAGLLQYFCSSCDARCDASDSGLCLDCARNLAAWQSDDEHDYSDYDCKHCGQVGGH